MHLQTLVDGGGYGSYGVGEHLLHRRAADRDLRAAALQVRGLPRLHQQAAVRPQARPRHAAAALRPGSAARQDRREARLDPAELRLGIVAKPNSLTANWLQIGSIGLARVHPQGRRALGLEGQAPQAARRPRPRHRLRLLPLRRGPADLLEQDAAVGRAAPARPQRPGHRVLRRDRDRAGLGRRARRDRRRGARHRRVRRALRDRRHRHRRRSISAPTRAASRS